MSLTIALGGDGALFGKDDSECSWLVRFLNIGQHILSRNENVFLFGANCSKNCLPVKRFITKLKLWDYVKKVKDADAVDLASTTKRNKVTAFIAKQKSRQELNICTDLISKAHIVQLHLKNNACALAHRLLLKLAISWSNLSTSISSFSQEPPQSIFFTYVYP